MTLARPFEAGIERRFWIWFSTRSGGMSLARSLKAGIERGFLISRRVATVEKRQPSLTRRRELW
jgi:hypothetical protein